LNEKWELKIAKLGGVRKSNEKALEYPIPPKGGIPLEKDKCKNKGGGSVAFARKRMEKGKWLIVRKKDEMCPVRRFKEHA